MLLDYYTGTQGIESTKATLNGRIMVIVLFVRGLNKLQIGCSAQHSPLRTSFSFSFSLVPAFLSICFTSRLVCAFDSSCRRFEITNNSIEQKYPRRSFDDVIFTFAICRRRFYRTAGADRSVRFVRKIHQK